MIFIQKDLFTFDIYIYIPINIDSKKKKNTVYNITICINNTYT